MTEPLIALSSGVRVHAKEVTEARTHVRSDSPRLVGAIRGRLKHPAALAAMGRGA